MVSTSLGFCSTPLSETPVSLTDEQAPTYEESQAEEGAGEGVGG